MSTNLYQRTPEDGIFKDIFRVYVQSWQTQSLENINMFGARTSGDEEIDRNCALSTVECYWTVKMMHDAFVKDQAFWLVERDTARLVADNIQKYLQYWANRNNRSLNGGLSDEQSKFMIGLDQLAEKLYPYAEARRVRTNTLKGFTRVRSPFATGIAKDREEVEKASSSTYRSMAGHFRKDQTSQRRNFNRGNSDQDADDSPRSYRQYTRRG